MVRRASVTSIMAPYFKTFSDQYQKVEYACNLHLKRALRKNKFTAETLEQEYQSLPRIGTAGSLLQYNL